MAMSFPALMKVPTRVEKNCKHCAKTIFRTCPASQFLPADELMGSVQGTFMAGYEILLAVVRGWKDLQNAQTNPF